MTAPQAAFELIQQLDDEAGTAALGAELALFLSAGDWIGLAGDLGAGKTTLARAIILALAPDPAEFDVPSPTFTLIQFYDKLRVPVAHCDFYRLQSVTEIDELGLEEFADSHISLVEWPDRLCAQLPADRLIVNLSISDGGRTASLCAFGNMAAKLQRFNVVRNFLAASDYAAARRYFFQGDASSRRYEKLSLPRGQFCVLMDMPDVPDGPAIRNGKPYGAIAHIATCIRSVLAVNQELCAKGLSAPQTLASDVDNGVALLEYLDGRTFYDLIGSGADTTQCLLAAVSLLAHLPSHDWPRSVRLQDGSVHGVPEFDRGAFLIEAQLLLDWFWPAATGAPATDAAREAFSGIWHDLYRLVDGPGKVWILRDFHSPNLIWLPERDGHNRVGLVDTQDAVLGHAAYDLVSLLQDARIDIPVDVEAELLDLYCARRSAETKEAQPEFDETAFRCAYAILGAQRATKVLGIFVRLAHRDGKSGYLKHISRVSRALERNLSHPVLAELKTWYNDNLPQNVRNRLVAGS